MPSLATPYEMLIHHPWPHRWQTETGAHMITPLPGVFPSKPGSATLPFFGVAPSMVNEHVRLPFWRSPSLAPPFPQAGPYLHNCLADNGGGCMPGQDRCLSSVSETSYASKQPSGWMSAFGSTRHRSIQQHSLVALWQKTLINMYAREVGRSSQEALHMMSNDRHLKKGMAFPQGTWFLGL